MGLGLSLQWTEGLIWALVQGDGHVGTGSPEGSGRSAHPRDATTKRTTHLRSGQPADPEECCVAWGRQCRGQAGAVCSVEGAVDLGNFVCYGAWAGAGAGGGVEGSCHPVVPVVVTRSPRIVPRTVGRPHRSLFTGDSMLWSWFVHRSGPP